MVPTSRRETIKLQAKRLRDLFDIDLTTAKYVLARGPYGCADWADLCTRLDQEPPLQGPLQLAEFAPRAASGVVIPGLLLAICRSWRCFSKH